MHSAERLSRVQFSEIRLILTRAQEMERQGQKVIHMEIGEPDFPTPAHIVERAIWALEAGMTHYASNRGTPSLLQAIGRKMAKDHGIHINPEKEVIVTVGAAEAILDSMLAFLNPGDEVIILNPCFFNYIHCAHIAGAKPVLVPLDSKNGFQVDPEALKGAVTPKTRMIAFNTPHNPTGAVLNLDSLKSIAEVAIANDLLVLSDEIYEKILFDGAVHHSIASLPGMKERTITINGFSKAYAMTGWRLAFIAADEQLIPSILKIHQYNTTCVTTFAQEAAALALDGPTGPLEEMVAEFDRRRRVILQALQGMEGVACPVPQGAFYIFPDIRSFGMSSKEFCDMILDRAGVAIVPGSAFGPAGEGFVRLSYATSLDLIQEGMERMRAALPKLGGARAV
ncbi:MAG: pyridoxal phosphate-dependent aminotransferase [Bacillota bacterium]